MSELKPCPFCGGTAHIEQLSTMTAARCSSCGVTRSASLSPNQFRDYDDWAPAECRAAITAWNHRTPDAAPPARGD